MTFLSPVVRLLAFEAGGLNLRRLLSRLIATPTSTSSYNKFLRRFGVSTNSCPSTTRPCPLPLPDAVPMAATLAGLDSEEESLGSQYLSLGLLYPDNRNHGVFRRIFFLPGSSARLNKSMTCPSSRDVLCQQGVTI